MIRGKMGLCAESVVRDAETNSISVFNILEDIAASVFPLFLQKLVFFALLERDEEDPAEYDLRFVVEHPSQDLFNASFHIDFQGRLRTRAIVNLQGLVIPAPGPITFRLRSESDELASYTIGVTTLAKPRIVQGGQDSTPEQPHPPETANGESSPEAE